MKKTGTKTENATQMKYQSDRYHGLNFRRLPDLDSIIMFDLEVMKRIMSFLIPNMWLIFDDYFKENLSFHSKVEYYKKIALDVIKQKDILHGIGLRGSIHHLLDCSPYHYIPIALTQKFKSVKQDSEDGLPINTLAQHYTLCNQFKRDLCFQGLLFQANYMEKVKTYTPDCISNIVTQYVDRKNTLFKETQKIEEIEQLNIDNDDKELKKIKQQEKCQKLKRQLKKSELIKLWKQFQKIIKDSRVFAESTTYLNTLEKDFFHFVLTGENPPVVRCKQPNFEKFSCYKIAYAAINILNYSIVPYLGVVVKSFEKDKEKMFLPGENGKKRIKNPKYESKVDEEQAYHLWLAIHSHKQNKFDITIELSKEELFKVFIKYGSADKLKFERIINNNVRFFKVENDNVIVFSTRTLLQNFGYGSKTIPKQYHRMLPSRRLFRYMVIYTLAERDYLETKDEKTKAEEEKKFGFIKKDELVHMPHGRSYKTMATQAKVCTSTIHRHLKNHPEKKNRIEKCGSFSNMNEAVEYSVKNYFTEKINKVIKRFHVYNIIEEMELRYIVAHEHVSCFYGGTYLYTSRVQQIKKPKNDSFPAVDYYDPLLENRTQVKRVEFTTNTEKREIIQVKYKEEEKKRSSYNYKKILIFQNLRAEKCFNPEAKLSEYNKKELKRLDRLIMNAKIEKEKYKEKHDSYKNYFLSDLERTTFNRMKKTRLLIKISEENGDMTFKPKLNGKTQKYEIPHQMVPAFLKQLNIQFFCDDGRSGNIVEFSFSKNNVEQTIQFDRSLLAKLRVDV